MMDLVNVILLPQLNTSTNEKMNLCSIICNVCGEENAHMAFAVLCCSSCRIFFRRNAHLDLVSQQCVFGDKCDITTKNRHTCRYCRLKKCFFVGMRKDLLRAAHGAQGGTKIKKNLIEKKLSLIRPLDLLENDRSLLTVNQWSLLSNITNAYDLQSPVSTICQTIQNLSAYPSKTRFKMANANLLEFIGSTFIMEPFIKVIPEFQLMTIDNRTALVTRNIQNLGGFNCQFIMRETNILKDFAYFNSLLNVYGTWIVNSTIRITENMDIDGTLIKLLLIILAFSTCSDVVYPQFNHDQINGKSTIINLSINTREVFKIQNIYVELMFKYMLFRYGYYQAASRFASLIKNFLYQSSLTASAAEISKHDELVKIVVDKTERLIMSQDQLDVLPV